MGISPFELNGVFTRTQDISIYKQNEDNKAMLNQSAYQTKMDKEDLERANQVEESKKTDTFLRRQDAKEKGKNEYYGDGGRKRKQKEEVPVNGIVKQKGNSHFDCSI